MQIVVDGQTYEFDTATLKVGEMRALKKASGMKIRDFTEGLSDSDPDALTGLVWLAKRRAGEHIKFDDLDFELSDFEVVSEDEPEPAADGENAAVPPADDAPAG